MNKTHTELLGFYLKVFSDSSTYQEKNDCLVKALSISLGIPYADSHVICKESGRPNNKGWYIHKVIDAAQEYGHKFIKNNLLELERSLGVTRISAKRFAEMHPKGSYIVTKRGHAFSIINGRIYNEGCRNQGRSFLTNVYLVANED